MRRNLSPQNRQIPCRAQPPSFIAAAATAAPQNRQSLQRPVPFSSRDGAAKHNTYYALCMVFFGVQKCCGWTPVNQDTSLMSVWYSAADQDFGKEKLNTCKIHVYVSKSADVTATSFAAARQADFRVAPTPCCVFNSQNGRVSGYERVSERHSWKIKLYRCQTNH